MKKKQSTKPKRKSWNAALTDLLNSAATPPIESEEPVLEVKKASVTRRKRPPLSSTRKDLLKRYGETWNLIPDYVFCAACGLPSDKNIMERHHPAGRRKNAFCFTFMLHTACHQRVHDNPAWATSVGLLWTGRNSKVLSMADALKLVMKCQHPPLYALKALEP
jgi:hypothetical protein